MYVILTTPNGWEGAQQQRMRQAAIKACLVDTNGGRRVRFVTEAEVRVSVNDSHLLSLTHPTLGSHTLRRRQGMHWGMACSM